MLDRLRRYRGVDEHESTTSYSVDVSHAIENSEWDDFVVRSAQAHHEQTGAWARLRSIYGWGVTRLVVYSGREIVAGAQMLVRHVPFLGSIAYIVRGPLISLDSHDLRCLVASAVTEVVRNSGWSYVVAELPYQSKKLADILAGRGYQSHPAHLPPSGLMTATALLDLTPDQDTLLSRMRSSTRYGIRRGIRNGVVVREGGEGDIEVFRSLLRALCSRRGVSPTPSQQDFFENLWKIYSPRGFIRLFLAECEGETTSAALAFTLGQFVRVWKVGWSGAHAKNFPNEVMWWEIIRWAKEKRFRFLDFVSVDRRCAESLAESSDSAAIPPEGATFFKLGFGPKVVLLQHPMAFFNNPFLRVAMKCGGASLLDSPLTASAISRFWNRVGSGYSRKSPRDCSNLT